MNCILSQWCTCQVKYPCGSLDAAFGDLIRFLEKSHKNHVALPVSSAVHLRNMYLFDVQGKLPMCLEAERRKTFLSWPHKEYRYVQSSRTDRFLCRARNFPHSLGNKI